MLGISSHIQIVRLRYNNRKQHTNLQWNSRRSIVRPKCFVDSEHVYGFAKRFGSSVVALYHPQLQLVVTTATVRIGTPCAFRTEHDRVIGTSAGCLQRAASLGGNGSLKPRREMNFY